MGSAIEYDSGYDKLGGQMSDFLSGIYDWLIKKSGSFKGGSIPNWVFVVPVFSRPQHPRHQ